MNGLLFSLMFKKIKKLFQKKKDIVQQANEVINKYDGSLQYAFDYEVAGILHKKAKRK